MKGMTLDMNDAFLYRNRGCASVRVIICMFLFRFVVLY